MPELKKPVEAGKKPVPELVPLSDLIAFKKGSLERERKMREELARVRAEISQTKSELQIAKVNETDDDEVKVVRQHLLDEDKRLRAERAKLEDDLTSFKEREREVRVQSLVTKYGVDLKDIEDEEDPDRKALELYAERLTREKEELAKKPPESEHESVFELGSRGGMTKVMPRDMTDEEFGKHLATLKKEALSRM